MADWLDKPEMIIAMASAAIAMLTAIFVAYQAYLSRRHNRVSVRPLLSLRRNQYRSDADSVLNMEYTLENNGLGPAIIIDYEIFFEKNLIGSNKNVDDAKKSMVKIIREHFPRIEFQYAIIARNFVINNGSYRELLSLRPEFGHGFKKRDYMEFVEKFRFNINYTSIYGERFHYDASIKHDTKIA